MIRVLKHPASAPLRGVKSPYGDSEVGVSYWRLYYHLVWTTKKRFPWIDEDKERFVHDLVASKCTLEEGRVYAINGMEEHVHLVVALPPTHALAEFVQKVKGSSTYFVNKKFGSDCKWQPGYGVFSVGPKGLKIVVEYVKRQKEHHRDGTLIRALELFSDEELGPAPPPYLWR